MRACLERILKNHCIFSKWAPEAVMGVLINPLLFQKIDGCLKKIGCKEKTEILEKAQQTEKLTDLKVKD